ncbi:MAG: hypothetical protein PSY14_06770 [bacterium]|nr:hypothetical protein [bacterium]
MRNSNQELERSASAAAAIMLDLGAAVASAPTPPASARISARRSARGGTPFAPSPAGGPFGRNRANAKTRTLSCPKNGGENSCVAIGGGARASAAGAVEGFGFQGEGGQWN